MLADSSVVNVSATENKDLFWALKGGGPNFGKAEVQYISIFNLMLIGSTFRYCDKVYHGDCLEQDLG